MTPKELNQLVARIETHIECWKQFNQFINIARTKKFGQAEENNFLELKSVIAQELEVIFACVQAASPSREEILELVSGAPSLRYLSELNEGAVRNIEGQWHRIYIGWHSILGQLKVQQTSEETKTFWGKTK